MQLIVTDHFSKIFEKIPVRDFIFSKVATKK